jgi:hypothetical protein
MGNFTIIKTQGWFIVTPAAQQAAGHETPGGSWRHRIRPTWKPAPKMV